jgi:hypothetical protein
MNSRQRLEKYVGKIVKNIDKTRVSTAANSNMPARLARL